MVTMSGRESFFYSARWVVSTLAVGLFLFASCTSALAEKRVALVFGNGSYNLISPLRNPVNDANLMARTLRGLGFEVLVKTDATQRQMKEAIRDFGKRLRSAGSDAVGLFYYAGHGVQWGESNYLIPLDAPIDFEEDLDIEAVPAQWVLGLMKSARNALNLVILDACRNNPFKRGFRDPARGLMRMQHPKGARGSIIAYAAGPGEKAQDGQGQNSPYTAALAAAMEQSGLRVEDVFKSAREIVVAQTGGQQTPWEESSLIGDFYFRQGIVPQPEPAGQDESGPGHENRTDLTASLIAHFKLGNNLDDSSGVAGNSVTAKNVQFLGNALYLNGRYEYEDLNSPGYRAIFRLNPDLFEYNNFAVAVDFRADLNGFNTILVGGRSYRWLHLGYAHRTGSLRLALNNQENDYSESLSEQMKLEPEKWYRLICSVDLDGKSKTILVMLGTLADSARHPAIEEISLPPNFELRAFRDEADIKDKRFTFTNYSYGGTFKGLVRNLRVYRRSLSVDEMKSVYHQE